MDVWRQMAAETAAGMLADVGSSMVAPGFITVAKTKLHAHIHGLRLLHLGYLPGEIDIRDIRAALLAVAQDAARHAMVGNVLALYAHERPNLKDTRRWRFWKHYHDRVDARAAEATRALRAALAFTRASFGAIAMVDAFPRHSAGRTAWMSAAERNAYLAVQYIAVAEDKLRQMRQAAMDEYARARILTFAG